MKIHGVFGLLTLVLLADSAFGQDVATRPYLADRGEGIHTSQFGTYVRKGEFLVYLYYEFYTNHDHEYKPQELGFGLDRDFFAKRVTHEGLVFLTYGITDHLSVEFDSALYTTTSQHKSSGDPSLMPQTLRETGLGDTEAQVRYRWFEETEKRPELISYLAAVFPLQEDKRLIGTQHWEITLGAAVTKGFSWGTLMLKASAEYVDTEGGSFDSGEYGIEYVKRLSDRWRLVLASDGKGDEVEGIVEMQWQVSPRATIKLNNGFGLTPKANDWAPEIGILFSF